MAKWQELNEHCDIDLKGTERPQECTGPRGVEHQDIPSQILEKTKIFRGISQVGRDHQVWLLYYLHIVLAVLCLSVKLQICYSKIRVFSIWSCRWRNWGRRWITSFCSKSQCFWSAQLQCICPKYPLCCPAAMPLPQLLLAFPIQGSGNCCHGTARSNGIYV